MGGLLNYKRLRMITHFGIPLVLMIVISTLLIFNFPIWGVFFYGIFAALIVGFAGYVITGQNTWVKAIQGDCVMLFAYDSSGIMSMIPVVFRNNAMGGRDVVMNKGENEETFAYSQSMRFRVFISKATSFLRPRTEKDTEVKQGDLILTFPESDYDKKVWQMQHMTVMFYNIETKTLVNRFQVAELERYIMENYLTLNTYRKMHEYVKEFRLARKSFISSLLNSLARLLSHPMFGIMVFGLIIVIVIIALLNFLPGLTSMVNPAQAMQGAGAAIKPLTTTAIP